MYLHIDQCSQVQLWYRYMHIDLGGIATVQVYAHLPWQVGWQVQLRYRYGAPCIGKCTSHLFHHAALSNIRISAANVTYYPPSHSCTPTHACQDTHTLLNVASPSLTQTYVHPVCMRTNWFYIYCALNDKGSDQRKEEIKNSLEIQSQFLLKNVRLLNSNLAEHAGT